MQLEEETRSLYKKYHGIHVYGCNWEKYPEDLLPSIALGIGPEGIATICRLMAKDYAFWSAGIGDLIMHRMSKKNKVKAKFITVQNEREEIPPLQKAWICHLLESNVGIGILRIAHEHTQNMELFLTLITSFAGVLPCLE